MNVLVLNAGSSSLKFRLLDMSAGETVLANGLVEKWGTAEAGLRVEVGGKPAERRSVAAETPAHAAEHAIEVCRPLGVDAIGHRVVHGGWKYQEPTRVTPQVIEGIREVSSLAPLHNGLALAGIEAAQRTLPQIASIAAFDTAFHRTIPPVAANYAIPTELGERHHLRRYGFHGISHQYVSQRLIELLGRGAANTRLITCHLGNGSSVCAVRDGKSVDTSMGLTPMEGLVMGTRSGDIDPGLVLHLMTALGMTAKEVDDLLNRRSGLVGLSGRSGDVRDLEQAAASGDEESAAALGSFAYRVRKYIGAYVGALGGIDAVAFTAGIGEHAIAMRARICTGLEFLGIRLDTRKNGSATGSESVRVSADDATVQVWVVPTDEERQIAREVVGLSGC
jgi:acetate kinase